MSRIAKIIILVVLLLAIALPIISSVNAASKDCNSWSETCLSGEPERKP